MINGFNQLPPQMMQGLMQQMGGPEQFQRAVNTAQSQLMQQNYTMEQYMQNPQQVAQAVIPQDRLQWAMQMANQYTGRR